MLNIFQYQGQEEDHYTHILMSILAYKNSMIVPQFLRTIIPKQSEMMDFSEIIVITRKKSCPQTSKKHEYIIGIAPYTSALSHSPLQDNSGSIPDAWICGKNFNLLFEFKIRGTLDEGQLNAHKRLLTNGEEVLRLNWNMIFKALKEIQTHDEILKYLIHNFLELNSRFKSKRQSSGMPKEIVGGKSKKDELHFIITGSRIAKPYKVEKVYQEERTILNTNIDGIQNARRFIARYVKENHEHLPLEFHNEKTLITDYCIAPGRAEHKNSWNQWRLGSYLK
ncbi:hypothetical protein [Bacillus sinesaloumensis]|uniref:hypothetical protein n=1 Tax=Litchfieldia sinesaloumensis TaxID=1926280 RepID=UPI001F1EE884|nr:hypothetical protein [Bacillus sinesaloumensis]